MKRLTKLSVMNFLTITVVIQLSLVVNVLPQEPIERFDFEGAYAEKTDTTITTGVEIITTREIYIAEFGNRMASYDTEVRKITVAGQNIVEETTSVTITEGNVATTYNPETMEGASITIDLMNTFAGMSDEEAQQFAEQMGDAMNTEVTEEGTGVVAGVTCNITNATTDLMGMITSTITWMYKKFVMRVMSEGSGTIIKELVTLFNEGADFDPALLEVPENASITEMSSPY